MSRAVQFIHTADWQIGMRANYIPGDDGAFVRSARFDTLRRIGRTAKDFSAQFVVVAGDVFEHHGLRAETVRRAFDALSEYPCNVYLLPGNHDPYTPDALYRTSLWREECPKQVTVLGSTECVIRDNVALLPCPLRERHALEVTDHLTEHFGPSDRIRVGIAHGGIQEILQSMAGDTEEEIHNTISKHLAHTARLDYLALGDWHGTLKINPRTWYSGTPEPTRFKEQQPGNVLLVTVPDRGVEPHVVEHAVATLKWKQVTWQLETSDDVTALQTYLERIPNRHETLLELMLEGTLPLELHTRLLDALEGRLKAPFRHLRVRDERLLMRMSPDDLGRLPQTGWIGDVIARLQTGIEGTSVDESQRALQLLHRLYTVGAAR